MKPKNKVRARLSAALLVPALLLTSSSLSAQDAATSTNSALTVPYLILSLVGVTIVLLFMVVWYLLKVLNLMQEQSDKERAAKLGIAYKPSPTLWQKFWWKINATVPVEEKVDDTGHDYDGIRELDNHLPPWWKGLFYATIVWGIIYLVIYHVTENMPLSLGEYEQELALANEQALALRASKPAEVIDENKLVYTADAELISKGKAIFTSANCASCHRKDGGGNSVGPNLTDAYWLHGGAVKNVFLTIKNGVLEKGMPAWGRTMSPASVRNVTFYVMSLQGSNPEAPKAPQGELFKPEPVVTPSDTTKTQAMK